MSEQETAQDNACPHDPPHLYPIHDDFEIDVCATQSLIADLEQQRDAARSEGYAQAMKEAANYCLSAARAHSNYALKAANLSAAAYFKFKANATN